MYEVTIIKSFSAAHKLADLGDEQEDMHGHNFKIEVTVSGLNLSPSGILIDFRDVKKWLNEILIAFNHKNLNDLSCFKKLNPSSENIAKYICSEMNLKTKNLNVRVARVKVWESENAAVTYIGDDKKPF